ncbi:MAG TPA: PKD-like domain-containing protein [Mucilaginibacter sp.]|nr:PKD-like domain-containing protein [Mucilaginibacter sp.]
MGKLFVKVLFSLTLFILFASGAYAQTITVGNVDNGPYGQGSTIAVPINIDDSGGCIQRNNTFNLYLSDASGNFTPGTLIGTYNGFYAAFINGTIPNVPAGTGYRVEVRSTNPAVTSSISAPFTITGNTGITAGASSQILNPSYPEVYGQCDGVDNSQFVFTNTSTAGTTTTATFYNELTKTTEASNVPLTAAGYTFTAHTGNYTVTVKAQDATGTVSTYDYQLINNVINTTIGSTGNLTVCLINGKGDLTINIDISSSTGIQYNYPGNLYTISWGDGSPSTVYTLCQIQALNGQLTHTFTKTSCGNTVVFKSSNIYCGQIGSSPSNNAKVIIPPKNSFTMPPVACAGSPVTITNTSDPGVDANTCTTNNNALYSWIVDGITVASNYPLSKQFVLPATTPAGSHAITLHLQNGSGGCTSPDTTENICLQNAPQPIFSVPATPVCLSGGPVTPTNNSIVDATCSLANQYIWTVTGPASVTYAGGTDANSQSPQFVFSSPGIYKVQLAITTATCGKVTAAAQTIVVNDTPVATLSPNTTLCGNNQDLTFDPNPGPTKTVLTGTAQTLPTTYTWTITGGAFSFQGGSNANSQYPQILFTDFTTYTIQVTHQNTCGTATSTQTITFVKAPTVTAGNNQTICASNPAATLSGKITGTVSSYQWVGGTGTFSPGRDSLKVQYTPSASEISAGKVTLALQATTALPAPCNVIASDITINITPIDNVTSPPAETICTGQPLNYTITASDPASTFTWTASVTSGTATGFTASGSGDTINDVITNTGATTDAVVVYKIIPLNSGCTGNTFTLTVTIHPLPVITASATASSICSNEPANILIKTNIPNTSYTWTSTAPAGITGNTNQSKAIVTTGIQDLLVNNSSAPGVVTYTITPYNGTCAGTPVTAKVTVQPLPIESVPGPDDEVCSTTIYTLQGNDPSPGTGKWTQVAGPAGATFSDDTDPNAVVSGLIPGNTYQFQWTITVSPTCPSNSNAVTIIIDKPTTGGSTAGSATVCSGTNNGQITLTGQQGTILRWESSTNNGATWQPIANITSKQIYSNLTQTTQFRAIVQSSKCASSPSSVSTITVNPVTLAADAGQDQSICNQTSAILNGNDPSPFNGVWTQVSGPAATIVNPSSHQTQVTGLVNGNVYTFMWTIKGLSPCADSQSTVNVTVVDDATASFTMDVNHGCGPTTVTFTNTSTPAGLASFNWDFGDGTTYTGTNPPPHTFAPSANGKEIVYNIELTPTSNCGVKTPFIAQVTVNPQVPVAKLFPSQTSACGLFTLTAQNLSPATNNVQYDFYLTDGSGNILQHLQYPDKENAVFGPINPTKASDYTVYLVATDPCGNKGTSTPITVSVSPSSVVSLMQLKGDPQAICLGSSVTFQNISSGGDRFTYTIYDANKNVIATIPAGTDDLNYTPTALGTYYVSIIAGNNGCGDAPESKLIPFTVYADPQPDFTFTLDNSYNATFINNTPDAGDIPATSLTYKWDFGDGTVISTTYGPQTHHFDYNQSPFTVTLTAINAASGCFGTASKTLEVKFEGGLYLPNAFMPSSSNSDLNIFKAKGTQLKSWHMQIFNNFGQLVWETTKLDSNGSPVEGWDGTYKGQPAQQGVYVWQISATFLDGSEWKGMSYNNSVPKRVGVIHLIR